LLGPFPFSGVFRGGRGVKTVPCWSICGFSVLFAFSHFPSCSRKLGADRSLKWPHSLSVARFTSRLADFAHFLFLYSFFHSPFFSSFLALSFPCDIGILYRRSSTRRFRNCGLEQTPSPLIMSCRIDYRSPRKSRRQSHFSSSPAQASCCLLPRRYILKLKRLHSISSRRRPNPPGAAGTACVALFSPRFPVKIFQLSHAVSSHFGEDLITYAVWLLPRIRVRIWCHTPHASPTLFSAQPSRGDTCV